MKKLTAAFVLLLAVCAARAENQPYIRAMFGLADAMQGSYRDYNLRGAPLMSSSDSVTPTFSAALGVKFESNVAVEAEIYTLAGVTQRWIPDEHAGLTAYTVNASEFFPFREKGKLNPFIGAGLGVMNSTFFLARNNALAFTAFVGSHVGRATVFRLKYLVGKTYGSAHNIFALEAGYRFNL